jgi:signal transduction histidine kinase
MCLFFCFSSKAQQRKLDSLLKVHRAYPTRDSLKVIHYCNIFRQYGLERNMHEADKYIDSAVYLAQQLKHGYLLYYVHEKAGRLYHGISQYARAGIFYEKSLDISRYYNYKNGQAGVLLNMGDLYLIIKDYVRSLEANKMSLNLYEQMGRKDGVLNCMMNIGLTYLDLRQITEGLPYIKKALAGFEKESPVSRGVAVANSAMASAYMKATPAELDKEGITVSQQFTLALTYYNKSYIIALKEDDPALAADIQSDIAEVYDKMGDSAKAFEALKRAIELDREHEDYTIAADNLLSTGIHFVKLKDDVNGLHYFQSAMRVAEKYGAIGSLKALYEQMSFLYERAGLFDSSLTYYKKFIVVRDSLYGEEKEKEITRQQLRIDMDIKEREYKYSKQLIDEELKQQILLSERRKDQLTLAEKEKSLQRLLFLQEQSKLANDARQQAVVFQQQQDRSRFEKAIAQKQINNQYLQLQYNRNLNLFFLIAVLVLLTAAVGIYYSQRKTKKLNGIISEQKTELEELITVKDQVLGTLSHDMRTPINSLISFTHLLENSQIPQEKLKLYASQLKNTLGYTQGLMDNLLKWATSQMHGFVPDIKTVDLKEITEQVVYTLTEAVIQKELIIENNITDTVIVLADRDMLASVIRNILTNAIKFSHRKGVIRIEAIPAGKFMQYSISDQGIGMDAKKVALINAYASHSVRSSYGTGQEKGNGLGLILCKSFISMMQGRMKVKSEVQEGTVFTVELPVS